MLTTRGMGGRQLLATGGLGRTGAAVIVGPDGGPHDARFAALIKQEDEEILTIIMSFLHVNR